MDGYMQTNRYFPKAFIKININLQKTTHMRHFSFRATVRYLLCEMQQIRPVYSKM